MLGILARWLRRRSRDVRAFLTVALRFLLVVAGLASIAYGVWTLAHWAGYITGGAALLVLEWVVKRR